MFLLFYGTLSACMQAWRPALQRRAFATVFYGACPEAPVQVLQVFPEVPGTFSLNGLLSVVCRLL